jgi:hypothetical protein
LDDIYLILDVLDALKSDHAGTTHHSNHAVAFRYKQLSQVRAILTGNSGDDCSWQVDSPQMSKFND